MKTLGYIYLLLILFLLLLYYKGATVTLQNAGAVLNKILIFLQGRKA